MNIEELLKKGKEILSKAQIEDAFLIARILLQYVLKKNRNEIIANLGENISLEQQKKYEMAIKKVVEGVPMQYIVKEQEFMGLSFCVDENVLIPQPDTEILVEEVLNIAKAKEKVEILDMCTGSGCIGISLAYYLKEAKLTLSDISVKALEIAKKNTKKNNVLEKTKFIETNMFEKIEESYDIIVSNPPYIASKIIPTLAKQVQNEPHLALDGGKDGLNFYRILIEQSPKYLKEQGSLCMEIGYDQKERVVNLAKQSNLYKKIEAKKDLAGNDRVVICHI